MRFFAARPTRSPHPAADAVGASPSQPNRLASRHPQRHLPQRRRSIARATAVLAALVLALVSPLAAPAPAVAEVRTSDLILGKSADDRGIAAGELPDIAATHAMVQDKDGTVYFARDAEAPIKIASITKVMTAIVALENAPLTDTITCDHAAATVGESAVGLKEGDTMTLEQALTGLLVMSGNDCATAIADSIGAKLDPANPNPGQVFLDAMNRRARELGCTDSVFTNPHGLDFGAWVGDLHSTAHDVIRMFSHAMTLEAFRRLDDSDATTMQVTGADGQQRTIPLVARNKIRGQQGNIGGKTGSTYEALDCFVGAFDRGDGTELYVAVFGSPDDAGRFNDTLTLANWYYNHLAQVPLANTAHTHVTTPIVAAAPLAAWSDKTVPVTLENPKKTARVFSLAGPIKQQVALNTLAGSVEEGEAAGTITYTQAGKQIAQEQLVCAVAEGEPDLPTWIMVQLDRAIRVIKGEPLVAPEHVYNKAPEPTAFDTYEAAA